MAIKIMGKIEKTPIWRSLSSLIATSLTVAGTSEAGKHLNNDPCITAAPGTTFCITVNPGTTQGVAIIPLTTRTVQGQEKAYGDLLGSETKFPAIKKEYAGDTITALTKQQRKRDATALALKVIDTIPDILKSVYNNDAVITFLRFRLTSCFAKFGLQVKNEMQEILMNRDIAFEDKLKKVRDIVKQNGKVFSQQWIPLTSHEKRLVGLVSCLCDMDRLFNSCDITRNELTKEIRSRLEKIRSFYQDLLLIEYLEEMEQILDSDTPAIWLYRAKEWLGRQLVWFKSRCSSALTPITVIQKASHEPFETVYMKKVIVPLALIDSGRCDWPQDCPQLIHDAFNYLTKLEQNLPGGGDVDAVV